MLKKFDKWVKVTMWQLRCAPKIYDFLSLSCKIIIYNQTWDYWASKGPLLFLELGLAHNYKNIKLQVAGPILHKHNKLTIL